MKYLLTTIAVISFSVFADDHKNYQSQMNVKESLRITMWRN
jgi:hypothetical protein